MLDLQLLPKGPSPKGNPHFRTVYFTTLHFHNQSKHASCLDSACSYRGVNQTHCPSTVSSLKHTSGTTTHHQINCHYKVNEGFLIEFTLAEKQENMINATTLEEPHFCKKQ